MDALVRDRVLRLAGVAGGERKFDPGQPRDDDGQWTDGIPGTGALKDALKLADRIDLDPGEDLVGSDKVAGDTGTVRMAATMKLGRPLLRIGIGGGVFGGRDDDAGPWLGGPDRTDDLNAQRKRLRDEEARLGDELDDLEESGADPQREARIRGRLAELDDMDTMDVSPGGYTARLDSAQASALRASLDAASREADRRAEELWAPYEAIERREAEIEAEIERLDALIEPIEERREPLRLKYVASLEGGPPISPEDDAELDRLTAESQVFYDQIGRLRSEAAGLHRQNQDLPEVDARLAEGVVSGGEWGDVRYEFHGTDDTNQRWRLELAVHPRGADAWESMYDSVPEHQRALLSQAETRKLLAKLGKMTIVT